MGTIALLLLGLILCKILRSYARRQSAYETHDLLREHWRQQRREAEQRRENSEDERKRVADALKTAEIRDPDLEILGLRSSPRSLGELREARRKAMFKAHPDRGGLTHMAAAINAAYERLAARV